MTTTQSAIYVSQELVNAEKESNPSRDIAEIAIGCGYDCSYSPYWFMPGVNVHPRGSKMVIGRIKSGVLFDVDSGRLLGDSVLVNALQAEGYRVSK